MDRGSRFGAEVCVLVPMYNEAQVVGSVVSGLLERFSNVVCVDDGSRDASADLARLAGARVLRHPVNLGQGAALGTGFAHALRDPRVEVALSYDADGQHRLVDAVRLAQRALVGDVDVVLGSRFLGVGADDVPAGRRALLRLATRFERVTTGLDVTDAHNGLRAFRRDALAQIQVNLRGMAHASELLSQIHRSGLSYAEEPVQIEYTDYSRAKGQRGINAFNILCDLAVHQLRVAR